MTDGQIIQTMREQLGLTRRRLASMMGISTRRMAAIEADSYPRPRKIDRRIKAVYLPYFGYSVRCIKYYPVSDRNFDLKQQQARAMKWFETDRRAGL